MSPFSAILIFCASVGPVLRGSRMSSLALRAAISSRRRFISGVSGVVTLARDSRFGVNLRFEVSFAISNALMIGFGLKQVAFQDHLGQS